MLKIEHIDTAIQGGIGYLESRLENGLWIEDFGVRHGPSDCWSTAYVGRLVRKAGFDFTNQSLDPLSELQKTNGGWAYNENVPPDADTTINVLVYLKDRLPQESYNRGLKFVLDHQNESGGIITWTIEEVKKMGYEGNGWSIAHTCTTALSLRVLEGERRERAIRHLRSRRLPDGSWSSYWWKDKHYLVLECSRVFGIDEGMRNYILGVEPTTTFGLGLKIQGLSEIGVNPYREVKRLVKMQNIDGSWGPSAIIKIPYPNVIDETDDDVRVVSDNNRTFSTAAAVLAFSKVRHPFLGI